ncbi:MAG: SWIM zinc finger family protein, partial [Candidatus Eisenbacteria bacterium]
MAIPSSQRFTPVPSREQIEALESGLAVISGLVANRGLRYYDDDRVGPLEQRADGFAAPVQGTLPYTTQWKRDRQGWSNTCTCPMGGNCKHAYAAALRFLDEVGAPGASRPAPDFLAALRAPRSPWRRARALQELLA